MFNPYFNNNFQANDFNPQATPMFGQGDTRPYVEGMGNMITPQPLPGSMGEQQLYPLESSTATPQFNRQSSLLGNTYRTGGLARAISGRRYRTGGRVRQDLPSLAETIRQKGRGGDTILAHINPIEAVMLKRAGGSGAINPNTGLPEFSGDFGDFFMDYIFPAAGAFFGNAMLPGIGGAMLGGSLAGAGSSALKKENIIRGGLRGGAIGGAGHMLLGGGAGIGAGAKLGAGNITSGGIGNAGNVIAGTAAGSGSGLSTLGALGLGNIMGSGNSQQPRLGVSAGNSIDDQANALNRRYAAQGNDAAADNFYRKEYGRPYQDNDGSWLDKLTANSKDYFTQPANLMTTAVLANALIPKKGPKGPKEKSPEQEADEVKRRNRALMLSPEELAAEEEYLLKREQAARKRAQLSPEELTAEEEYLLKQAQATRRIARNKYLPAERLGNIAPRYTKTHSPEEYRNTGKWLSYYDNPQFQGNPVAFADGGRVGLSYYLGGQTGGQDDKIPALLSDGEYVFDADTVASLGDGNSNAGARKLDEMRNRIRKHKHGGKIGLPPKAKSLADYMR